MRDFMFGILFHLICTIKESLKSYFHLSSGHTMLFYLNLIFNQLAQVNRLESILEVLTLYELITNFQSRKSIQIDDNEQ